MTTKLAPLRALLTGAVMPYAWLYLLAGLAAVLEVASIGLVFPVIHAVITGGETGALPAVVQQLLAITTIGASLERLVVWLIVIFVLKNLLRFLVDYGNARLTNQLRARWMHSLFSTYLSHTYQFFISTKHGTLVHNLFDLTNEAMAGLKQLVTLFMYGLSASIVVAALFTLSWQVTVVTLVALAVVYAVVNRPLVTRAAALGRARLKQYQLVNALPAEAFKGIREIKMYSAAGRLAQQYTQAVQRMAQLRVAINFYQLLPGIFPEIVLVAVLGGSLITLQRQGADLVSLVPLMGTYTYALFRLLTSASVLLRNVTTLSAHWPSVTFLAEELSNQQHTDVTEGSELVPGGPQTLALNQVSFAYEQHTALNELSAQFTPGTLTAIVGASGAGKSTLADLLMRMVEPTHGVVQYGGQDIATFALPEWRQQIGLVSQETFLWHGSIRDNITFGEAQPISDEAVITAAQQAQAHDFIVQQPQSYDTVIGERGDKLSGGQRQRLAIARALLKQPRVLLFDEATSALDAAAERGVMETITALKQDRIVIVITHRLASVTEADHTIVMKQGAIVQTGTHQALKEVTGEYQRLWAMAGH